MKATISKKFQKNNIVCHCGGELVSEELMNEKKDACYYKVKLYKYLVLMLVVH
jgi:hypothetical protein